MKRRDFLKKSLLGIGLATITTSNAQPSPKEKKVRIKTRLSTFDHVSEPSREIPVVAQADIVVIGGGPAGVASALSAAKSGASVILVERYTYLGGLWTGGEVLPVLNTMGVDAAGQRTAAIKGVMTDITQRLFNMGMAIHPQNPRTDPEATKYVLAEMLHDQGVQVIYHSWASQVVKEGDRIDSIVIECKSGRLAIRGKFFIDCSGDGDVFCWAGEDFEERKHHIGVMWRIGNASHSKMGGPTPIKGVRLMHTDGEMNQDGLDVFNLSRLQYNMRKYMWEQTEKARQQEGCEDLFMLDSPSQLGVRCTRVLKSHHRVTMDDSMHFTKYDDIIGMSGGSASFVYQGKKYRGTERTVWQIPYRSLLPHKTPNLLVAGRCFDFDEALTYDAREIGTCFVTGQAAGTAAGLAVSRRTSAQDVEVPVLQQELKKQGVLL